VLRTQGSLPFNPTDRESLTPTGAFNTADQLRHQHQLAVVLGRGLDESPHPDDRPGGAELRVRGGRPSVAVAFIRGITRTGSRSLGNFWVDLTRGLLRILLPLSLAAAIVLMSQGVVQNLSGNTTANVVDTSTQVVEQQIPGGPVASQEAIKELGTNGGGFYNANSAHPFENPNGLTNLLQIYMLLVIPLSLVVTFGQMVKDRRQSRLLLSVMAGILVLFAGFTMFAEQNAGNPQLAGLQVDQSISRHSPAATWRARRCASARRRAACMPASTTGTSTGAVNCMHDSFTPLGGMAPMLHMMLGEISPGGVGVGLWVC
jgi:K+-transporting ATPase ATPase A chain